MTKQGKTWPKQGFQKPVLIGGFYDQFTKWLGVSPSGVKLGRTTRRKGYTVGRELREGCMVPNRGGGLCQVTGLLYQAALEAGLEIVERHEHSLLVPGSMGEKNLDATVFWNYVDLRCRAPFQWRLEVELDASDLIVRIKADRPD